jgi:hypothetical protein
MIRPAMSHDYDRRTCRLEDAVRRNQRLLNEFASQSTSQLDSAFYDRTLSVGFPPVLGRRHWVSV